MYVSHLSLRTPDYCGFLLLLLNPGSVSEPYFKCIRLWVLYSWLRHLASLLLGRCHIHLVCVLVYNTEDNIIIYFSNVRVPWYVRYVLVI